MQADQAGVVELIQHQQQQQLSRTNMLPVLETLPGSQRLVDFSHKEEERTGR